MRTMLCMQNAKTHICEYDVYDILNGERWWESRKKGFLDLYAWNEFRKATVQFSISKHYMYGRRCIENGVWTKNCDKDENHCDFLNSLSLWFKIQTQSHMESIE